MKIDSLQLLNGNNSMNYRNGFVLQLKHDDVSNFMLIAIIQEQDISSDVGRLHGAREDHDNWTLAACGQHQGLPDH